MIKVGIIGGAGYTAGELLRILINHPAVQIVFVNSSSNAGNRVDSVHSGLCGETELAFTDQLPYEGIDVLFFCTAHGDTKKFLETQAVPAHLKIIDLSTDYRKKSPDHDFVYGLPELNTSAIRGASRIANPGCFATSIELALLPLASAGLLIHPVHVNATTGSTGAGQKPTDTSHYSWRSSNLSIYKPFGHQHLSEIRQSLSQMQPSFDAPIHFIPVRGTFARGIYSVIYTECPLSLDEAKALYEDFYKDAPFTFLTDTNVDLKQVVNTNKCLLHLEKHGDQLLIISVIDNLLKGASGQAVHNMNLLFGRDPREGLNLKAIGF